MPNRIGALPTIVLAAIVLSAASSATARAQTTLLDVRTGAGDTVATVLADNMRVHVPLHVLAGGFLAQGAHEQSTTVDPPATGAGSRMMWYPEKSAFRAGAVTGTQWDRANVGAYSMALGSQTEASGLGSTALGSNTDASGLRATALGVQATASGDYSTALGHGTLASGFSSTALGWSTTASGDYSTTLGFYASANAMSGSFVYGDASTATEVTASGNNQFVVRAVGGTYFYTSSDLSTGVSLSAGSGTWASVSDAATKENFRVVDGEAVLAQIADMPIPEWNYRTQDASIRHLGPVAQDFHAAFGLGENNTTISVVDADGVNMLAIQALVERTDELQSDYEALRATNAQLREEIADTQERLADTEQRLARVEALLESLTADERERP